METITRKAYRVGNSAGVLVPKEWMNGFVEVRLVEPPIKIDAQNIFKLLQGEKIDPLEVMGIAVVGSYARKEENEESDVDILIITSNLNKKIKIGKYEIVIISEETLNNQLENIGFPLLPMVLESKPIMNKAVFQRYKKRKLSRKSLKWLIDTTESSIKISEEQVSILRELGDNKLNDNISYSLILRLRTVYMIEKIMNNKVWNKREFLSLIKQVSGSLASYQGYVRVKNNKKIKKELKAEEAEKLISYIKQMTNKLKDG